MGALTQQDRIFHPFVSQPPPYTRGFSNFCFHSRVLGYVYEGKGSDAPVLAGNHTELAKHDRATHSLGIKLPN